MASNSSVGRETAERHVGAEDDVPNVTHGNAQQSMSVSAASQRTGTMRGKQQYQRRRVVETHTDEEQERQTLSRLGIAASLL